MLSPPFHLRVLVVEDEELVRTAIEHMLRHFGCEVVGESNPARALQRFRQAPSAFDLVTLDFQMPTMTGIVLAQHLREIRPDIPMILVSAFLDEIPAEAIKAAGIRVVVEKPFRAHELSTAITRAIGPAS